MNTKLTSWKTLYEPELRSLLGLLIEAEWKPSQHIKEVLYQFQMKHNLFEIPSSHILDEYIKKRCGNTTQGLDGGIKTVYGTFKFSAHAIDRIKERAHNFNHLFFGKHIDKFEIAYGKSVSSTFKHGYAVYLRCKLFNLVLVVSPSLGALNVVTAYQYSKSGRILRKLDWCSLKDFQGWEALS